MCEICFIDPDDPIPITVSDVTQTSVKLSWSVGQTNIVNATSVYYRATGTDNWESVSATGTSHTVTSLQPGTEYQFYVKITSYGKSSSSENTTSTTGKVMAHIWLCIRRRLLEETDIAKYYKLMFKNKEERKVHKQTDKHKCLGFKVD